MAIQPHSLETKTIVKRALPGDAARIPHRKGGAQAVTSDVPAVVTSPSLASPRDVLQLQRLAGNRAVQNWLQPQSDAAALSTSPAQPGPPAHRKGKKEKSGAPTIITYEPPPSLHPSMPELERYFTELEGLTSIDRDVASSNHEIRGEDREKVRAKILAIRRFIDNLKPAPAAADPAQAQADLAEIKAYSYRRISQSVPWFHQTQNLDILWSVGWADTSAGVDALREAGELSKEEEQALSAGKKATKAQKALLKGLNAKAKKKVEELELVHFSAAGPRTCNVTALTMSLEGLGLGPKDFKGDLEAMRRIFEYQQGGQIAEIQKANFAPSKEGAPTYADQAADLKRAKFEGLRFADLMQVGVLYYYLTAPSGESKKDGLGHTPSELVKAKPEVFNKWVDEAHELARNGILFKSYFPAFAEFLFDKSVVRATAVEDFNKETIVDTKGKKHKKGPLSFAEYRRKVEAEIIPLLRSGQQVEISRPGHFVYLVDVTDEGLVIKNVGSWGERFTLVPWKKAHEKGYVTGYVAYRRTEALKPASPSETATP